MLRDIEEAQGQRVNVVPEPSTRPTSHWLRQEVHEILESEGLKLSNTATKNAVTELKNAILRAEDGSIKSKHTSLTKSLVSVACGWFISGGGGSLMLPASIGGQTLCQGVPSHRRDQGRDLPASKGFRKARDVSAVRCPSAAPLHDAIHADRHDDLAQAAVALLEAIQVS